MQAESNIPILQTAVFAGGCFWCVEHDLRALKGVVDAVSGFCGGKTTHPTYSDHEGHKEAVQITCNPIEISYTKLVQFFLDHIDPTDAGGQFYDRGESYATAIFYKNEEEKKGAENLIQELAESKIYERPIVVQILKEKEFYKTEEYHQKYAEKNPAHYGKYAASSGRLELQKKVCEIREDKKISWKE
jgi:methionine-S-sulfoxide reductase